MFTKLDIYKALVTLGASTAAAVAAHLNEDGQAVADTLGSDASAFAYDQNTDTFTAVPGWAEASGVVTDSINSLAELFLKADSVNPDELAIFLTQNGVSTGLLADGEYVAKRMGAAGGELDQLAAKFGFDPTVPGAEMYLSTLKQQFLGIAAILHALKLKA